MTMTRLSPKRIVLGFILVGLFLLVILYFNSSSWSALRGNVFQMKENGGYKVLPVQNLPVKLEPETEEEKEEERQGFKNNGFNQFISDRLPLNREVPDTRDER